MLDWPYCFYVQDCLVWFIVCRIAPFLNNFLHCVVLVWILSVFCGNVEFMPPLSFHRNLLGGFFKVPRDFKHFTCFDVDYWIFSCLTHDPFIIFSSFIVLKWCTDILRMYFCIKPNCFIIISSITIIIVSIICFNLIHLQEIRQNNL